jgi:transcriptional regulator with XRE-family HTH domain
MQHLNDALALRRVRLEAGWTYKELAARIGGLTAITVQRFIEQPQRRVRETTAYKVRRFLEAQQDPPTRKRRARAEARVS